MWTFQPVLLMAAFLMALGSSPLVVIPVTSVLFLLYYMFCVAQEPEVIGGGPLCKFLYTHIPTLTQRSWPTPWLLESRTHTIFASLTGDHRNTPLQYRREIMKMHDGGQISLDWYDVPNMSSEEMQKPPAAVAVALSGITGDSHSEYFREVFRAAVAQGIPCVAVNYRGCGNTPVCTPRLYCAANCDDLVEVIEFIHQLHPTTKIICLGFSLGGLLITRYLSSSNGRAKDRIAAAMTVSATWDIGTTAQCLQNGLNRIFDLSIVGWMKEGLKKHKYMILSGQPAVDYQGAMRARTCREFDACFTSRNFGYRDLNTYYQDASLMDKVNDVSVPLLVLSAKDDDFVPEKCLPIEAIEKSSNVALVRTPTGGHLGFLEGLLAQQRFSVRLWSQFLEAIVAHSEELKSS